ncbi:MAG TPA: hypothetical protein GXZ97_00240 [Hydrogenispora sp.]|nr:hypothetical protein [Hydrogenispora sp.]
MKRIGPVLLLALVLGGVHLLANTVNLSYPVMSGLWNKNSFTLEYTTFYTGCQHEERKEERHAQQKRTTLLARLTNEGWVITNFATERVELGKEVAKLCRECQEKEFVGIYGNEIGVYAGSPEKPGPLKQVIPVDISRLPQAEIDDLKAGIVCHEAQEKWRILEGYQN